MTFWDKVENCNHENFYPDYYVSFECDTPYCTGYEIHCKDCGAYISQCGCNFNNGISGWSYAHHRKLEKKKAKESKEKVRQQLQTLIDNVGE